MICSSTTDDSDHTASTVLTNLNTNDPKTRSRLMTPTHPYKKSSLYRSQESICRRRARKGLPTKMKHVNKLEPLTSTETRHRIDDMCKNDAELSTLVQEDQAALSTGVQGKLDEAVEGLLDSDWETNLNALKSLIDLSPAVSWKDHERYIATVYRRFIDFLKSPRSSIVRVTCQVAGELFKTARCYKRPEFDEIVGLILSKTADPNRFIQKDANISLDKMVTFIPLIHAVRTISVGTAHKNPLVRTATARLFVCACALNGVESVLGSESNPRTRKRILTELTTSLTDKCCDVRKYGERLYKILRKHKFFGDYFYKDMECDVRFQFKKIFATLDGK